MSRILIAGMGNVLRRDDGFGVAVARRLLEDGRLPPAVRVVEVGIGGIHLVHELLAGYDVLIVLDAVERGSSPGTLHLLAAEVPDLATWSEAERRDFLADMHYSTPSRALILAKAVGVLPSRAYILGCQPDDAADFALGLHPVVEAAVEAAIRRLEELLPTLGAGPVPVEARG